MHTRDIIAIILALAVFITIVGGIIGRFLGIDPMPGEVAERWTEMINVLVGVLSGYIMGRINEK